MPSRDVGPDVPQTFVGLDRASSICTTRHPANVLTGIVLRLLQEHFANPENLEYNGLNEFDSLEGMRPKRQLQGYTWDPDNTKTAIQIQPVWMYNTQDVDRTPGLYVKRNAQQPQRIAIDDGGFVAQSRRGADGKVIEVEGQYYAQMVVGSHTIFVVSKLGAEAELLGQEVFNHLMMFGPAIRQDMRFHRFLVHEVGELSLLEEFDEHYVVPVVAGYAFSWAWRLKQVAPWLKTLAVDVRAIP